MGTIPNYIVNLLIVKKFGNDSLIFEKNTFCRFSGMETNIICTTVSAEVMLSFNTHSWVMPTAPMQ